MSALTQLTIAEARNGLQAGDFTAVQLTKAFLRNIKADNAHVASRTYEDRLNSYKAALVEGRVDIKNLSPSVLEVMEYAADAGFDESIFSFNPIKVVGGSDAAVNERSINGSAINSTQELSTMSYLGTDVKTGDAVILVAFISNAYSVDFKAIEEKSGIRVACDDSGNPTDDAKFSAGEYLDASHGFFNPQVVGQYANRTAENEALPPLRVLMHDMLLKTPTHTGTIVTNAGHNQVNWENTPSEFHSIFRKQLGDNLQVVQDIGIKRDNCWQVDLSPIYLFGGNPPKVLQEMQSKVEQAQAAMLKLYTGNAYVGDHWRSNLNTTSSNQAVLSMDLKRRSDTLWEKEVKPHIIDQIKEGVTTIAIADGASNYFVPHMRELIEDLDLENFVHVISYAEELVKHVQSEEISKVHLLATGDGLKMGNHSIFAPLSEVTQVITPQDSLKIVPVLVDDPNKPPQSQKDKIEDVNGVVTQKFQKAKPQGKMPCPEGRVQETVIKDNTQAIKISKIESLLREVKDADGNVQPEHAELLREAIAWIPDGETVVLGATELELIYLDDNLSSVFDERNLKVISPVMGLVAPAVVANATHIKQPEIGKYRSEDIPDAPQSNAADHTDIVALASRLAVEYQPTAQILKFSNFKI